MISAFVFGKFLPFHKGHEAMMHFALTKCDRLTVLVCASDREMLSGAIRKRWIDETFAGDNRIDVQVFDYREEELPNSSVPSQTISEIWAHVFSALLPDHSLLITSEPYGDYVAGFMNIQHIPFDPPKQIVPVSATDVRTDLLASWAFLPAPVRRDLLIKVVILGTESTGKTTLTENLSAHFSACAVLEAGRDLIPDSNNFSIDDLYLVATEHARRIDAAVNGDHPLVIIDTDIHITRSYGRFTFHTDIDVSDAIYDSNRADLHLYLNNDVDFVQDGTRLEQDVRNQLDASHRQVLTECRIPFIEINGNWEERFQAAVAHIEATILRKGQCFRLG